MLETSVVNEVLATALRDGGDFAEIFVEDTRSTSALLDDGKVEKISSGRDRGAGVRVVVGDTAGYAHTSDLSPAALAATADAARAAARAGGGGVNIAPLRPTDHPRWSHPEVYPEDVEKARKVELLRRANDAARAAGPAIKQVSAGYGDRRRRILVANTEGVFTGDDQVYTNFRIQAVATGDTGMQTGFSSMGRTIGFEVFDQIEVEQLAREAADQAVTKLRARPAPSGTVVAVIGAGSGGVMFHEACGHGLEADAILKDASVYAGRVGQRVASPLVTLVDDATIGDEWGSFAIDDEGHPAGRNVLIEDGILTDYMWDWLRARKEGRTGAGNGRRESYHHVPMVRMTNTFVLGGAEDPGEIIAQTPSGIYVKELGGGQVDPATGDFVFGMTEAYLIEDGQVTEPLRDGNLIGNGPKVLEKIDALGSDFAMGRPGACGKMGQSVPVGDGNPTLRVTEITVGGTAA